MNIYYICVYTVYVNKYVQINNTYIYIEIIICIDAYIKYMYMHITYIKDKCIFICIYIYI